MKPTVYLGGPIAGLSYDGATDWREMVIRQLADVGIQGVSPLRAKSYLKARGSAPLDSAVDYGLFSALSSHRGITTRDLWDVERCDALLFNFLCADRVSIGSVGEVFTGRAYRRPIVAAIEPSGNPHEHGMLMECIGFRVPTLDEAIDIVKALLL